MEHLTMDDKLGLDKFRTDEGMSHIEIDQTYSDRAEIDRLILACPAGLYSLDEDGRLSFDFEGCLECGTCRVLCGGKAVKRWDYPRGDMGVNYRKG